jgi:hypothetical protein
MVAGQTLLTAALIGGIVVTQPEHLWGGITPKIITAQALFRVISEKCAGLMKCNVGAASGNALAVIG